MKPVIYLIHGLYFHGKLLVYIRGALRSMGYDVRTFSYPTVHATVQSNAKRLVQFVQQRNTQDAPERIHHFVGHSLGGLVIRAAYAQRPALFNGRIVTLGTPHIGSHTARHVVQHIHPKVIGSAYPQGLDGQLPEWTGETDLGSIAGTKSLGVSTILRHLSKPNDGTVTVPETRLPNMADHITLPVSHTQMVYSKEICQQIDRFLRTGRFAG